MPQQIRLGCRDLVEEAKQKIDEITVQEVQKLDKDQAVIVDVRDIRELSRDGKIPGAFHCPRGMLEFWIDPDSPYHKPIFQQDKTFIFYCASGWRSALATNIAGRMGLKPVANLAGGFSAWKEAGGAIEQPK
jgi:rhodanese-related sulfurtransferase